MKLRIKGNSIRIRLSKSEVQLLCGGSQLEERTNFGSSQLVYIVEPVDSRSMSATFESNTITLYIPMNYLEGWQSNSVVGFDETMVVDNNEPLQLLIEKDFKCLDESEENQSDFFENPAKIC